MLSFVSPFCLISKKSNFIPGCARIFLGDTGGLLHRNRVACKNHKFAASNQQSLQPSDSAPDGEAHEVKPSSDIPVHFRIPFIGFLIDNLLLNKSNLDLARKYGPIYKSDLLGMPVIFVTDPYAVARCWKDTATFQCTGAFPSTFQRLFGSDLMVMSDGKDHARMRGRVLPAFSSRMIAGYFGRVYDSAVRLWNEVSASVSERSKPFVVEDMVRSHFLRIVVAITTGAQTAVVKGPEGKEENELVQKLCTLFVTIMRGSATLPFGKVWDDARAASVDMEKELKHLATERLRNSEDFIKSLRGENNSTESTLDKKTSDLLTTVVAASSLQTDDEELDNDELVHIAHLVFEVFLGGYFTNTSALLSALMELEMNPDLLRQLREEQATVPELTLHAVQHEMPLLHAFLLEILRMYPPVAMWYRKTSKATNLLGYEIPANSTIVFDIWSSHRNPSYFPHPDAFDSKRFLHTTNPTEVPSSLLSFGSVGGPHFCVGVVLAKIILKTTVAVLLRNYDFKLVPRTTPACPTAVEFQPKERTRVVRCEPLAK